MSFIDDGKSYSTLTYPMELTTFLTQAETHSKRPGPPRASRRLCAEAHSKLPGSPLASVSGTYFFLFLNRLQAQAHRDPGSSPRASRTMSKNFFIFLFLDYKHKRAPWHSSSGPGEARAIFY